MSPEQAARRLRAEHPLDAGAVQRIAALLLCVRHGREAIK